MQEFGAIRGMNCRGVNCRPEVLRAGRTILALADFFQAKVNDFPDDILIDHARAEREQAQMILASSKAE
jgi:hypothetical protein